MYLKYDYEYQTFPFKAIFLIIYLYSTVIGNMIVDISVR